jgi:glycopeptide antibiotics resistance protein
MARPSRDPLQSGSGLRGLRITALVLLIAFGLIVTVITLWPGPPDPDGQRALREFLLRSYSHGLPTWITFGRVEFAANIVMFVPIGLFGALVLVRHSWLIVPIAVAASIAIEVFQSARLVERVGTPRDVIANGLGALIGYLCALLVLRVARRRSRRRGAAVEPSVISSTGTVPADA